MKYYVCRYRTVNGIKTREIKRTKCLDYYVSEKWAQENPDKIWQFSKQGATSICKRENERNYYKTVGEYHIIPVERR